MFKSFSIVLSFLLLVVFESCSQSENYKEANSIESNGETFIRLKGRRPLRGHNLGNFFSNKTYEDSLLLKVPSLQNGIIEGKDIPVRPGYYRYLGKLTIQEGKIQVHLSYDNTDDRKIEPLSWNGKYILVRDEISTAHNNSFKQHGLLKKFSSDYIY